MRVKMSHQLINSLEGDPMSKVVDLTDDNFDAEVLKSGSPVLVDFAAEWCGPCKRLAPIIDELAGEYAGKVKVARVDVDESRESASKYNIMSVPTMIFFKGGKPVDQVIGLVPKKSLEDKLKSLL